MVGARADPGILVWTGGRKKLQILLSCNKNGKEKKLQTSESSTNSKSQYIDLYKIFTSMFHEIL